MAARPTATATTETADSVLTELQSLGKPSYKAVMMKNHGVSEPIFGVPISELQKIRKRIKKSYALANDLYRTGNYDAMYLAGLIADDAAMTREDLTYWVTHAQGGALAGTTVASVAASSPYGIEMAEGWIHDQDPIIAVAGWATWSAIVSITADEQLELDRIRELLAEVQRGIHQAPDLVRYQMNQFVIAVGCYIAPLTDLALQTANEIGEVKADLGNNQCQVFSAPDYIQKVQARGAIGKKRKSAKC